MLIDERGPDVVHVHPLQYLRDGDEVVVGRTDIDSYGIFPPDGVALIKRLSEGAPLASAGRWYEETFGAAVDMVDFIETLQDLQFIVNDRDTVGRSDSPVRWSRLAHWMFCLPAGMAYALIIAAGVAACVAEPHLRPHRGNIFFSHYLLVIELGVAFGQLPLILLHELFHVLAGRRLGCNTRIRVGRRLYFVVFETVMDGLVMVPRGRRYVPMLSGILADLLVWSALTLAAAALLRGGGLLLGLAGLCLALAFSTLIRVGLEFLLFLRTDIYYLIVTLTGCVDLHETSRQVLVNRLWRLLRRPDRVVAESSMHPTDRRTARWYAPIHAVGYLGAIVLLFFVLLPISWHFLSVAIETLDQGRAGTARFWDAAGLLAMNLAQPALALVIWLWERAATHRHRPAAPSIAP